MKFSRAILLTGLLWCAAQFVSAQPAVNESLASKLQITLDAEFAAQRSTGFTAAISMPDGSIWLGTAGKSNPALNEDFRTDHRIGFASITKTFVAAAILQLVEEGVLTLDDRVDQWLPSMRFINPAITIRHMLNHQSGAFNFTNHGDLGSAAIADTSRYWTPEEIISSFLAQALYSPGQGSGYSNTNYILLGMILKAATGKEASTIFRERLLDPNQLADTYLGSEENATGDFVTTWVDLTGDGILDDNSAFYETPSFQSLRWTAGGMISTPENIVRWSKLLFTGDILEPETRDQMATFLEINGTGAVWTGYGLGIQEYNMAGATFWGHSGSTPGATSLMAYAPDYDISVVVAANDNRANHVAMVSALFETARASLLPTNSEEEIPVEPSVLTVHGVYPNPFESRATITYELLSSAPVSIRIFDVLGRELVSQHLSTQSPGYHQFTWNDQEREQAATGLYLYTIATDQEVHTGQIIRRR